MKRPDRRHLTAGGRHSTRRDGAIAAALLLLPWLAALVMVCRHRHLDSGTVATLVAVSIGSPTLWVTWAAYRDPRRAGTPANGLAMPRIADQLAIAVATQWREEAAIRRLNDPYPLPVSWTAADPSLTDSWDSLLMLATSGAGWPPPPSAKTWAAGPEDLDGEGSELVDVLASVPTGRLVVLGEPGAGKTMLMVRLVLDLLGRRAGGGPVPVLASAASWDPVHQDLRSWLVVQLLTDYPALARRPPTGTEEATQAAALLSSELILPVLDGLDEIPEQVRGAAIRRINDALRPGQRLVVTCRTQQYQNAVRPKGDAEVTLRAAAAIQLRPLDADTVRTYLCNAAAGPVARSRWSPVLQLLGTKAPVGQALDTPLMVGLAHAIYNGQPDEMTDTFRDPAELCRPALNDRAAVESWLFDAFIPAAYRHESAGRSKAREAERWFAFLAYHLEYTIKGPDLAWWQLPTAVPGFARACRAATGIFVGALAGAVAGSAAGAAVWAVADAVIGAVAGDIAGIAVGSVVAVAVWWVVAAAYRNYPGDTTPLELSSASSPPGALVRDRRTAIVAGIAAGIMSGSWVGVSLASIGGFPAGIVAGSLVGSVACGIASFAFSAWPFYGLARIWLALLHQLPWRLFGFLDDAHRRGILRQAGVVYQFRHIELQHRLANRADLRRS
jgi:hypothetical protein